MNARTASITGISPTLRPVKQLVIGEDERHHRRDHRRAADADAGIVPALGDEPGRLPRRVDRRTGGAAPTGRLDGDADDVRLTGRNAAGSATGLVRQESGTVDAAPPRAPRLG